MQALNTVLVRDLPRTAQATCSCVAHTPVACDGFNTPEEEQCMWRL